MGFGTTDGPISKQDREDELAERKPDEVKVAKKGRVGKATREALGKHDPKNPKQFRWTEIPPAPKGVREYLHRGKLLDIKGRLGDGPCVLLKGKLKMPNGDYAEKGDTFDPVYEGMSAAEFAFLVKSKHVKPNAEISAALAKRG